MAGDRRVEHHLDHHYRLHCRPDRARVFPGPPHPKGFLLTTVLGIVGAFVATFIGQSIGWYRSGRWPHRRDGWRGDRFVYLE